jgi:hypothetical protein
VREKLNSNPVLQAAVIGVLGIAVAFLLFTRVVNRGGAPPADPATTTEQSATPAPATPTESSAAPVTPDASGTAGATTTPAPGAAEVAPPSTEFQAGKGLPKSVVEAHNANKVVAILIVRGDASDDQRVRVVLELLNARPDTEVFVVKATEIAKYSRITQGVSVDRTPALIVIEPKRLVEDGLPTASISYGYRGLKSAAQAINDALYKGKENLPYHP